MNPRTVSLRTEHPRTGLNFGTFPIRVETITLAVVACGVLNKAHARPQIMNIKPIRKHWYVRLSRDFKTFGELSYF